MRPPITADEEEDNALEEQKMVNEEYKVWKKNTPYLYDIVLTHALDWPSLTCQWLPDKESPPDKPYDIHRVILGTHTSGQSSEYLQIATVQLPRRQKDGMDRKDYDGDRGELGGHSVQKAPRFQVIQKIPHTGEVNRARYMPQNTDLIATKTVSGEIFVFDRTKHSSEPDAKAVCKPDIRLIGQRKEGFGLAWNPSSKGHILGASEDMTVCQWDVNQYTKANSTIEPTNVFKGHQSVVGDVSWNAFKSDIFTSVGDDRMLMIWDTRDATKPSNKVEAHEQEILAVSCSPASEHLVLTGSSDKTVALWDTRNLEKKLHSFEGHTDEVLHLAWSPHHATVFASASSDRRINLWDLAQIGVEQSPDDAEDGAPELVFVHGGHTSRPTDFCWAPGIDEQWTASTVAEDNIIMVWQPAMHIWAADEMEIAESELEISKNREPSESRSKSMAMDEDP